MFTRLWMQTEVIQVTPDTSIGEAKEILDRHHFRHLPVVENNVLLGIVTSNDLDRAMPSPVDSQTSPEDTIIATQARVSAFMANHPITVEAMTPMEDVAKLLQKFKIGAIPVVEGERLIGIITETDLFKAFIAIMDGKADDVRIEMLIDKKQSVFYKVIDCCKRFKISITSISLHGDYSTDQQLLTIRINGKDTDELIEAFWDLGVKINQVLK